MNDTETDNKMNKRKCVKICFGGLAAVMAISITLYVLDQMGSHYSQSENIRKYAAYPYYDAQKDQFISPVPLKSYPERTTGGNAGYLRFLKGSPNAPIQEIPKVGLQKNDFPAVPSSYTLYWLGHSSVILELDGLRLLIDPVLDNAAPFPGLVRRYTQSPISRKNLPQVDAVLITHDHYDHLESKTMKYLKDKDLQFIVPLGVGARLKGWGVFDLALHPWNESIQKVNELSTANNITLLTPLMGEKIIPGQSQTTKWW